MCGLAALLSGCGDLLSLHPLYTEKDRVFDAALEGRWEDDDNFLLVEREEAGYLISFRSKTEPAGEQRYEMRLLDLAGVRLADLLPADGALGHMILKVEVAGGVLRIAFFDSDWLRKRIPHESVRVARGNTQAVLTARTARLRRQVEKYVSSPEAYGDPLTYRRAAPGGARS
ncbi:MAG: hypothetical protein IT158_15455 [Bryobacterales bacterium]|nr:hypothetical protein [Bryobacterales bacterium]